METDAISKNRSGYLTFNRIASSDPITKPIDSQVKTKAQDLAPLKYFNEISGPRTASPADQLIMIAEKPTTPATIQR